MRVVAFAPALIATEIPGGGINAAGFPMTIAYVDAFPTQIAISVVISVCALNGDEYDPVRYLIADSPSGERLSAMEFGWHWDDDPDAPVKFRVFCQQLPIMVRSEGIYTLGFYRELEGGEPEQTFPLEVSLSPRARR